MATAQEDENEAEDFLTVERGSYTSQASEVTVNGRARGTDATADVVMGPWP